nr:PREDICTED: PMS1 protein homolog 1 isoform X2 [Latimeria chalumnae]|eukprot:XP_005996600.1 PREDICTED: PMS1 protein homolog 1 isoform X2 [Latimeria chalumnae]
MNVLPSFKAIVWQKVKVSDHKMALMSVLGTTILSNMLSFQHHHEDPEISLNGFLPKPDSDRSVTSLTNPDKSFIFVNCRPVHHKEILKLVREYYNLQSSKESSRSRYPIFFLNITISASTIDVNLAPDKTQIMLQNKEAVLSAIENILIGLYGPLTVDSLQSGDNQTEGVFNEVLNETRSYNCNRISDDDPSFILKNNDPNVQAERTENSSKSWSFCIENSDCCLGKNVNSSNDAPSSNVLEARSLDSARSYEEGQSNKNACDINVTFTLDDSLLRDSHTQCNREDFLKPGQVTEVNQDVMVAKDLFKVSADSWSKGHTPLDSAGEKLEPVKILAPWEGEILEQKTDDKIKLQSPGKPSPKRSPSSRVSNVVADKVGQITAYDLISNQIIRKPMSASDTFIQEARPRILAETPAASVQEVSKKVDKMWKNLSEEEKKKYEEKAAKDLERYNMQTKKAMEQCDNRPIKGGEKKLRSQQHKLKAPLSNQQLLDKLFQSQAEKKSRLAQPVKTVQVPYSLSSLKHRLQQLAVKCNSDNTGLHLIGCLSSHSMWIVASERKLMFLNPLRVEEALLFKRLLEKHILPAEALDTPIVLSDSLLGGPEYTDSLCSMQKESAQLNGLTYFSDPRLVANGFKIRVIPGTSVKEKQLEIEGMANCLPFYGASDLREILRAVVNKNARKVEECRPRKVINYLEGEAVRLGRQLPLHFSKEDIQDTIHRMKQQLGNESKGCVHGRPFFHHLIEIPETE